MPPLPRLLSAVRWCLALQGEAAVRVPDEGKERVTRAFRHGVPWPVWALVGQNRVPLAAAPPPPPPQGPFRELSGRILARRIPAPAPVLPTPHSLCQAVVVMGTTPVAVLALCALRTACEPQSISAFGICDLEVMPSAQADTLFGSPIPCCPMSSSL